MEKYSLPVSAIHCTKGELKGNLLSKLNAQLHFDDSEDEVIFNKKLGIKTVVVSYHFDATTDRAICKFD